MKFNEEPKLVLNNRRTLASPGFDCHIEMGSSRINVFSSVDALNSLSSALVKNASRDNLLSLATRRPLADHVKPLSLSL